jgi:hypothetical protein
LSGAWNARVCLFLLRQLWLLLLLALLQEVAAQDMEQWQGQLEAFKKQLHVEKQQGEAAVELAAARLTIAEGQELEARCQEVGGVEGICIVMHKAVVLATAVTL